MAEYEVKMDTLRVRVEANSREEAQQIVEKMMQPSNIGRRLLGAFGMPALKVDSVEETDLPVGAGSEAD